MGFKAGVDVNAVFEQFKHKRQDMIQNFGSARD